MSKGLILINGDTDSIMVGKPDGSPFSDVEQKQLLTELNSQFPENIRFEEDGYFSSVIILKAKNYILQDQKGKVKTKGSALRDQKKEKGLREMMNRMIEVMLKPEMPVDKALLTEIYMEYVKEIVDVKDITRWCTKKSYSQAVETSTRTNETKVKDAIQGTDYKIGDKLFLFYKEDDTLCLIEKFSGDYSKVRLLKRLFDTVKIFANVIEVKELFINYSLKKNQKLL